MASKDSNDAFGDDVDEQTFEQILEMDDDDPDREFSSSIVFDFFTQTDNTFKSMNKALEEKDLNALSELGHFLKGSSATLGFTHVKDACEKIQNLGKMKDETGEHDESDEGKCLRLIREYKQAAERGTAKVEKIMLAYYGLDERPDAGSTD